MTDETKPENVLTLIEPTVKTDLNSFVEFLTNFKYTKLVVIAVNAEDQLKLLSAEEDADTNLILDRAKAVVIRELI